MDTSAHSGKKHSRLTTRWSRPGQPGVWLQRDTSLGLGRAAHLEAIRRPTELLLISAGCLEGGRPIAKKPNDPWTVLRYETKMYGLARRQIAVRGMPADDNDLVIKNALVESAMLHTRGLADIMLSRGREPDDIVLRHLLPEVKESEQLSRVLTDLKIAWGDNKTEGSPCWTINKMLAHPTMWRSASYDYGALANRVDPQIYSVIKEIAALSNRSDMLEFL